MLTKTHLCDRPCLPYTVTTIKIFFFHKLVNNINSGAEKHNPDDKPDYF